MTKHRGPFRGHAGKFWIECDTRAEAVALAKVAGVKVERGDDAAAMMRKAVAQIVRRYPSLDDRQMRRNLRG
jgi:hypothetical protein